MAAFCIRIPKSTEWSAQSASAFLRSIFQAKSTISGELRLHIRATSQAIEFAVVTPMEENAFKAILQAIYPLAEVYQALDIEWKYPFYRSSILFERNTSVYYQRSITADQITKVDPLALLTQTFGGLIEGEYANYVVWIYNIIFLDEKEIQEKLTQSWAEAGLHSHVTPEHNSFAGALAAGVVGGFLDAKRRTNRFSPTDEKWYRWKLNQPIHTMYAGLFFDSPNVARMAKFSAALAVIQTMIPSQNMTVRPLLVNNENDKDNSHPVNLLWDLHKRWKMKKIAKNEVSDGKPLKADFFT